MPPTKPVAPTKTVEAKAVQELGRTAELLAKQIAAQKKMLEMLEARQKASGKEDGGTGRTDKAVTAGRPSPGKHNGLVSLGVPPITFPNLHPCTLCLIAFC